MSQSVTVMCRQLPMTAGFIEDAQIGLWRAGKPRCILQDRLKNRCGIGSRHAGYLQDFAHCRFSLPQVCNFDIHAFQFSRHGNLCVGALNEVHSNRKYFRNQPATRPAFCLRNIAPCSLALVALSAFWSSEKLNTAQVWPMSAMRAVVPACRHLAEWWIGAGRGQSCVSRQHLHGVATEVLESCFTFGLHSPLRAAWAFISASAWRKDLTLHSSDCGWPWRSVKSNLKTSPSCMADRMSSASAFS